MPIVSTGQFTITDLNDGIRSELSKPAHVLPASAGGVVSTYTGSGTQIRVYQGGTELTYDGIGTANGTWRIASTTPTNITVGTITDSGTFATIGDHSVVADATDTSTIQYNISGRSLSGEAFTLSPTQTFSKARAGAPGANAVVIDLSNDNASVPANFDGSSPNFTGVSTTLSIFEGGVDTTASWTIAQALSSGLTGTASGTPANRTFAPSGLTVDSGTVTFTATRSGYATQTIVFTITKAKAGTPGTNSTVYDIRTSQATVKRLQSGSYSNSSLVVSLFSTTGTGAPTAYAGRFIIATSTDGTTYTDRYTSAANESSYTYSILASVNFIRVSAYLAGGTTTLIDQEIIPVADDGVAGQNNATITLYQRAASAPTAPAGNYTYTFSTRAITESTGSWTAAIPAGSNPLYVTTANASSNAATATITFSTPVLFVQDGTAGVNARAVSLTIGAQAFAYNAAGTTPSPTSTTATATAFNTSGTVNYEFVLDGTSVQNGTTNTYTYTPPAAFADMPDTLRVNIRENSTTSAILASDTIAISGLRNSSNGIDALTPILSNAAHTLPTATNGTITYTGSGTNISLFEGTTELVYDGVGTANGSWKVVATGTNITPGGLTDGGNFVTVAAHSAMTATTASVSYNITGKRAGGGAINITVVQTLSRAIQGATGDPGTRGSKQFFASGTSWSDSVADAAITSPNSPKVLLDQVTISGTNFSQTRYWNGTSWIQVSQVVDGNLLVNGTVGANALTAGTILANVFNVGSTNFQLDGAGQGAGKGALFVKNGTTNMLTAGYIDGTNIGLSIKDAAGNVLMQSSAPANSTTASTSFTSAIANNSLSLDSVTNDALLLDPSMWLEGSMPASRFFKDTDGTGYLVIPSGVANDLIPKFATATPIDHSATYEAQWEIMEEGSGTPTSRYYTVVYCWDAAGTIIPGPDGTYWYYPSNFATNIGRGSYERRLARFGKGTARPFPANAVKFGVGLLLNYNAPPVVTRARRVRTTRIDAENFSVNGDASRWQLSNNSAIRWSGVAGWTQTVVTSKTALTGAQSLSFDLVSPSAMCGLTDATNAAGYADLDYAFYAETGATGVIQIYESGSNVWSTNGYTNVEDVRFRIEYDGNRVKYYINGGLARTVTIGGGKAFRAAVDCNTIGAGFRNIRHVSAETNAYIGENTFDKVGNPVAIEHVRNNLALIDWWKKGATIPWNTNGESNSIVSVPADSSTVQPPIAGQPDVWFCEEVTNDGNAGGGWHNIALSPLNPDKTYRFVVPIRRLTNSNFAGQTTAKAYWGTNNVANINTTTLNSNPYFAVAERSAMQSDRWYLFVGYIFPRNSTGKSNDSAGVWDCKTGQKISTGTNYAFLTDGSQPTHRAYQFYAGNGSQQMFGMPLIEPIERMSDLTLYFEDGARLNNAITIDANGNFVNPVASTGNGTTVANSKVTIDGSGKLVGIGTTDVVVNNAAITVNGSGQLAGIGTANVVVDNTKVTVDGNGKLVGIGTSDIVVNNTKITIDQATGQISGIGIGSGQSVANNRDSIIRDPGGALSVNNPSSVTGALKIRLPQLWTSTMMRFTVDIYEYAAGLMCTMEIGGYNYWTGNNASSYWTNVTARVLGGSNVEYPVYFGNDGTKCCVWIGTNTETWSYPQVRVKDFLGGHSNSDRDLWSSGWAISFDTTEITQVTTTTGANQYNASVTDTLPGADWSKTARRPGNLSALSGTEAIQNTQITVNGSGQLAGIGTANVVVQNTLIQVDANGNFVNAGATGNGTSISNTLVANRFVSRGSVPAIIEGNSIRRTSGNENYTSFVSGDPITGACFAEAIIQPNAWTMVAFDKVATTGGYLDQDFVVHANPASGLNVYVNGAGYYYGAPTVGQVLRIVYDGTRYQIFINGAQVGIDYAAPSGQTLFPIFNAYNQSVSYIGLNYGPYAVDSANTKFIVNASAGPALRLIGSNTVARDAGTAGWTSHCYSSQGYEGGAFCSFTPTESSCYFMAGLNTDPTTDTSYTSIDYAFYMYGATEIRIYENGSGITAPDGGASFGTWEAGTVLSVIYDNEYVRYLINGDEVRCVRAEPRRKFFFDSSVHSGGPVSNIQFGPVTPESSNVDFIHSDNRQSQRGNSVYKNSKAVNGWNTKSVSRQMQRGNAVVSARLIDQGTFIGLHEFGNANQHYNSLAYSFHRSTDGTWYIYESGAYITNFTTVGDLTLTSSTEFRIEYDGVRVRYWANSILVREVTAGVTANVTYQAGVAIDTINCRVTNIQFGAYTDNNWGSVGGANRPEDNATYGAITGTNLRDPSGNALRVENIRNNLALVDWWKREATIPWSGNGGAGNEMITMPHSSWPTLYAPGGIVDTVMLVREDTTGTESAGGWNSAPIAYLDPDKTYRFVVPILQPVDNNSASAYWGTDNVATLNTTTNVSNPYFAASASLTRGRWHLFIGYIFPRGSTNNTHDSAGIWDTVTGQKVATGTNYCFRSDGSQPIHRAYQYYAAPSVYQFIGRPLIECVDGTQSSLREYFTEGAVLNTYIETQIFVTQNTSATGNTIRKTGGTNSSWDSQAYSKNGFTNGAFCTFSPDQILMNTMVGLNRSTDVSTNDYWTIDYAFYCNNGGDLRIYESGTDVGSVGTYAIGDLLSVTYDGSRISYIKNGSVLRTVAVSITQALHFDSSFYVSNTSISKVNFGPMSPNNWTNIGGSGKPEDNATVGANIETNLSGTFNAARVGTFFADASIGNAKIGSIEAGKITTGTLAAGSTITVGSTGNAAITLSGQNRQILVKDAAGAIRVKIGDLSV